MIIRIALVLCAFLLSPFASAALTNLNVTFSPSATQYVKGEVVTATAASDGTNVQYRFFLERTDAGVVLVSSTNWSSENTFVIDTYAVNIPPGTYQLRTEAREALKKKVVLSRTDAFSVVTSPVTACESIEGKTYTNATASTINFGNVSLAQALSGLALTTDAHAAGISAVSFAGGNLTAAVEPINIQVCSFICVSGDVTPVADLTGTYSCAGNTLSLNASGTGTGVGAPGDLLGSSVPITLTGSMTITQSTDVLTAGGQTFE